MVCLAPSAPSNIWKDFPEYCPPPVLVPESFSQIPSSTCFSPSAPVFRALPAASFSSIFGFADNIPYKTEKSSLRGPLLSIYSE
jgi:hypothetical protein